MGVIGVYTPATNFRIRTIFLGDEGFDTNVKRQSIFWEFQNANYYHALSISDYRLSYIVETNIGGGSWVRKQYDISLTGVGVGAYCYYKDAVSPITIDAVWDYDNQQLRVYVDGYLLGKMTQLNPINIIAINQAMTLSIGLMPSFDSFSGTETVTYSAVNTPNTTTVDPTPKKLILKDYHPQCNVPLQDYSAVPDILLQGPAWPNIKADPSANFWIGVVFNVEFMGGSLGGYPIPANIVNKSLAVQAWLSQNLRYEIRVIHGNLQTFIDGDFANPNSLDRALIALANANPQIPASFASSFDHEDIVPPEPPIPNLKTMPYGTPNSALDGMRNTLYNQILTLQSLMTRMINEWVEDDETVTHLVNDNSITVLQKSQQYVTWINWMLGKGRTLLSPLAQNIVYDIYDLWRAVNTSDLQIGTIVQVNTTNRASMSMYPQYAAYTYKTAGNFRGLWIALKSKISEKLAGINRNDYFVTAGFDNKSDRIVRPGPYLGFLKGLEVLGNDKFRQGYFTPFQGIYQNPKNDYWQLWAPPAVKAVCSRPDIRAILDNGVLLPGDVLEFPSIPTSQKMFLFDCGNKLVLILAKKWAGEYVIWAYYVRPSNYDYQDKEKTVTFNLEGNDVTVTARWQGSLYKRDLAGNLEHFDDWHEESEWNWWNQSIIITNGGNDMAGINDMGNGIGFLYQVAKDGTTILSTEFNNVDGMRTMRDLAVIDAPMAFNRASTGIIHITSVAGAGTIDDVQVDGNSLLAGPYSVGTSNPTTEAEGLAAAINAYTPSAGYKYRAFNIGGDVYLQSPLSVGGVTNGLDIVVSVSTNTIVTSTESFHDGNTSTAQDYDELSGRRYFLNADYNSQGVPDTIPAVRTSLTYAIEITKYVNMKGLQGGMPTKSLNLVADSVLNVDRNSVLMTLQLNGEGAASDVLAFIAPDGFVNGDLVFLKNVVDGTSISVESAPTTTSPSFYKNIYLNNDDAYALDTLRKSIVLQYQYDIATSQGSFVEMYRSMAGKECIFWEGTYSEAGILMGNNELKPCNTYKITDAESGQSVVILTAATDATFNREGTYVATYDGAGQIGGTYNEVCEYDYDSDLVYYRSQVGANLDAGIIQGNNIRTSHYRLYDNFPFGYINIFSNTFNNFVISTYGVDKSTLTIVSSVGNVGGLQIIGDGVSIINCNFSESCSITNVDSNVFITNMNAVNATITAIGDSANLSFISIINFGTILNIAAGKTLSNCSFLNYPHLPSPGFTINNNYENKIIQDKLSTFNATVNPSAAKYIVMDTNAIAGIVNISSIAAAAQIDAILGGTTSGHEYDLLYHNITIKPDSGISVDIRDISVASAALKNIYLSDAVGGTTLTLNGTKGDWAEFEYDGDTNTWRLVNFQTYP